MEIWKKNLDLYLEMSRQIIRFLFKIAFQKDKKEF